MGLPLEKRDGHREIDRRPWPHATSQIEAATTILTAFRLQLLTLWHQAFVIHQICPDQLCPGQVHPPIEMNRVHLLRLHVAVTRVGQAQPCPRDGSKMNTPIRDTVRQTLGIDDSANELLPLPQNRVLAPDHRVVPHEILTRELLELPERASAKPFTVSRSDRQGSWPTGRRSC